MEHQKTARPDNQQQQSNHQKWTESHIASFGSKQQPLHRVLGVKYYFVLQAL
jgi:hypothetical protein